MGTLAASRSRLHCFPASVRGSRFSFAPSRSARKAMPRTSAAVASRCFSLARPGGGTRSTRWEVQSKSTFARKRPKNSSMVALTAHSTSASFPSGRCATTVRCRRLGGTACSNRPPAGSMVLESSKRWPLKTGASSMTSRFSASWRSTSRKGMELEVFPPCCTCKQMPKSSWNSRTLLWPLRFWIIDMKAKSSPRFMSSYVLSRATFLRKTYENP
mmetsp:Transcript_139038/g.432565  ORF Transcript_139038/g.432565 Transcript_139038/m.432565 type:complete len:215 (-) Transcript_139038:388-1032(-)